MITEYAAAQWDLELDDLFLTIGHRFGRVELRRRMRDYVRGLLAPVARKNSWQLAEQAGHPTPDGLQHLPAGSKWEPDDIRDDLQEYVADKLGEAGGVLIIDDTGFIKKGTTSAGVQRQYSGTAGRTENCQIGVFAAYASARGRALVDRELYLPESWTEDRERCRTARVPDERQFATKGELARHMVLRALASPLPITWVTADSAYGQDNRFRRLLEQSGVGYVLAVPKSQFSVGCSRIEGLFAQAPDEAWEKISCGDGAKGPRVYHWAAVRLPAVAEFDYQGEVPHRMRWALARRSISNPDEIAYGDRSGVARRQRPPYRVGHLPRGPSLSARHRRGLKHRAQLGVHHAPGGGCPVRMDRWPGWHVGRCGIPASRPPVPSPAARSLPPPRPGQGRPAGRAGAGRAAQCGRQVPGANDRPDLGDRRAPRG
ncbi:IS701 family transposase [Streptomyces sp. NPDC006208]|uniref:IS701 family transposase n=1 Tax=Streptomyces sp. NPDC006208 TaxID=3156734 RepID=UPI0033B9A9DD